MAVTSNNSARIKLQDHHPELKAGIRHNYDSIARWYDLIEGALDVLGLYRKRKNLLARASGHVLEVAVGTGANLRHYPPGLQIDAVDMSPGMMAIGRRKAARMGLEVSFQEMDAEALTYPDDHFDSVVSTLSSCTFPNPVAALQEMARVLRPEGVILLLEHGVSEKKWLARLQKRRSDRHFASVGCRWDRDPPSLVREAGLTLEVHHSFLLGMGHLMVLRQGAPQES